MNNNIAGKMLSSNGVFVFSPWVATTKEGIASYETTHFQFREEFSAHDSNVTIN
jgi:hypothetical protein